MLVRDVVTGARDTHPACDKKSTPDAVACRFLARWQQGLLTEITRWKRDALHVAQEIDLPLAVFADGEALDDPLVVHGGKLVYVDTGNDPIDLQLVEYPLRLDTFVPPAAYVRAGTLFLLGRAEDWTDFSQIVLDLFPRGPDTVHLGTELLLPGTPQRAAVAALGAFMCGRAKVEAPDPAAAVNSYLDEVTGRHIAKVGQIREVF